MKFRATLATVLSVASLSAQNEIVFVGTSVGGSTDPHFFASSGTGLLVASGGNNFTDNVTDAVWMDGGTNLYVAKSLGVPAGNFLARAQWNGTSATWSTFFTAPGSCYGLGVDRANKRLWTLTGASGTTFELVCLNADPASAAYGQVIAQTTTLSGVNRERWELSRSGRYAAVPHVFLQGGGLFQLVDTAIGSPTFGQVIHSAPVTGASGLFTFTADCAFSGDDLFAYVLYSGVGAQGIAVLFIPTLTWLDFDATTPGQQDFAISLTVPTLMDVSPYSYSPVISGIGGAGWAARIDLDPFNPQNATLVQYQPPVPLTSCDAISLSADGSRVALSITSPPSVLLLDFRTGAMLHNIALPGAGNIYTTAWQDLRPDASITPYGSGCAGSLGVPTLAGNSPPRLGTATMFTIGNLPVGIAIVVGGLSNTMSGATPLPLNLGIYGMPGCSLLADPAFTTAVVGGAPSANWMLTIPFNPRLLGFTLYSQAFSLDPPANAADFTVSNGVRIVAGI